MWLWDPWYIFAGPCELASKGWGAEYVLLCGMSWVMFLAPAVLIGLLGWVLHLGERREYIAGGSFVVALAFTYFQFGLPS